MQIAILGYGKEGKSAEAYFQNQNATIKVFDNLTSADLQNLDLADFNLVLRSPSIRPLQSSWSSSTKYFFAHCPCPIIGVTGTKGKGTTCSIITALLEALEQKVWLVGNIGNPALNVLDQIQPNDVVVYEMSSFQLWDLTTSPQVAVVLGIEPDHLNVHQDFAEYVTAKSNIARHQTAQDTCIYYKNNPDSAKIAQTSAGTKIAYPVTARQTLDELLNHLAIPGQHNRDNAEAALLAVAAAKRLSLDTLIAKYQPQLAQALENFQGLPHRLQFLRELGQVKYYDDNFCTNAASLEVALKAFPHANIVLIAGGRDKTNNADLPEIANLIQNSAKHAVLIGESGHELAKLLPEKDFILADNLPEAVRAAQTIADKLADSADNNTIVLMSPAAASFDMFENVYDRGAQFQALVEKL